MTKEQSRKELENYKRLYEALKIEHENLLKETENIEAYRELNLELQLKVKKLEKEKGDLEVISDNLRTERDTYRETYDILTRIVGDKHCY